MLSEKIHPVKTVRKNLSHNVHHQRVSATHTSTQGFLTVCKHFLLLSKVGFLVLVFMFFQTHINVNWKGDVWQNKTNTLIKGHEWIVEYIEMK